MNANARDASVTSVEIPQKTVPMAILYGLLAAMIWGAWPVASRFGIQQTLNVFDITALRLTVAGLLLLPLVIRRGVGNAGWVGALVLSFAAGAPYVLIGIGGFSFAPAGHGGVIIPSFMLAFSTLGGWLILGDRPNTARLAGLAIIMAGIVMIGWHSWSNDGGTDEWIGHLMFVAAGLLWATYTVASRAWAVDAVDATALVSVLSMVLYMPFYLIFGQVRIFQAPVSEVVFQGLFQGVAVGILALLFYTRAVEHFGAARGAVFAALVPGMAVLFAYPALNEVPTWLELAGVGTVTAGMVLALRLDGILFSRR